MFTVDAQGAITELEMFNLDLLDELEDMSRKIYALKVEVAALRLALEIANGK